MFQVNCLRTKCTSTLCIPKSSNPNITANAFKSTSNFCKQVFSRSNGASRATRHRQSVGIANKNVNKSYYNRNNSLTYLNKQPSFIKQPFYSATSTQRMAFSTIVNYSNNNNEQSNKTNNNDNNSDNMFSNILSLLALGGAITTTCAMAETEDNDNSLQNATNTLIEIQEANDENNDRKDETSDVETQRKLVIMEKDKKNKAILDAINVSYDYVLVGSGLTVAHSLTKILKEQPTANVLVVSEEDRAPYSHYSLTFAVSPEGMNDPDVLKIKDAVSFENLPENVHFVAPAKISSIDVDKNIVQVAVSMKHKKEVNYKKCLLALENVVTFSNLQVVPDSEDCIQHISSFTTAEDYEFIKGMLEEFKEKRKQNEELTLHIAVAGSSMKSCELATALAEWKEEGVVVHQVIEEENVFANLLPPSLALLATSKLRAAGINIIPNAKINSIELADEQHDLKGEVITVNIKDKDPLKVHHIIYADSIPNIGIHYKSNYALEVEATGGLSVNSELRSVSDVFVAGDLACFYDATLRGKHRVENSLHARESAITAARNMLGEQKRFTYPITLDAVIGDISFYGVGTLDASYNTVGVWLKPEDDSNFDENKAEYNKGIVYYLHPSNASLRGIIIVGEHENIEDLLHSAQALLRTQPRYAKNIEELKQQLPMYY